MPTQTRPPTRSLRELNVDERIRMEGREERALSALAWLERVVEALRDEHPERLATLAADAPDESVFDRLSDFVEQQRWAEHLVNLNGALDRMGVSPGALGGRLQQLVSRARITWPPGRWRLWRRAERHGAWVRLGDHSFHLDRAEAVAVDDHWATFDGVRVELAKLRELGVSVKAATLPVVAEVAPIVPAPELAPAKPTKRKPRAKAKRAPVITGRGVAWGTASVVGLLFALQARNSASARPVAALFVFAFLAFLWRSRRPERAPSRKKRRSRQLDLSFIPLLQRDAPHPVEKPGRSGRPKRERKPKRR